MLVFFLFCFSGLTTSFPQSFALKKEIQKEKFQSSWIILLEVFYVLGSIFKTDFE